MTSPTIARLAFANFIARRTRFTLTILAVAMSVALVVSISSGYASIERAIRHFIEDFVGAVDFEITRPDSQRPAIPAAIVAQVRADPRVAKVTTRIEANATPLDASGVPMPQARLMLFGVEDDPESMGRTPRMDAGRFLRPGERDAIVVDQNALLAMKAKVGDVIQFAGPGQPLKLTIVGVLHKPAIMGMFFKSGYLGIDTLASFVEPDRPTNVTKVRGEFAVDVDSAAFVKDWNARLAVGGTDVPYKLTLVRDSRADLDRNLLSLRLGSYLGSTVGLASAAFIILATLMTGVQEQHRQLAMLRAVGATRFQVARLVSLEGLFIGLSGALLGIPLGGAGVFIISRIFPDVFDTGVVIDWAGAAYAVLVAGVASLLAGIMPAIWASRARPLEAMASASEQPSRLPWAFIIVGVVLASLDSLLIFGPLPAMLNALGLTTVAEHSREVRMFGHFVVGLPMMLLGALLLAPLVVWVVETLGRRVLSTLLRVPSALLKQQLSESPWRSAATGVSMMIGLMLLITMNAQGRSALGAWKLPTRFPDVFIVPDTSYGTLSIKPGEIEKIRNLPQLQPDRVMPISVTAPTLGQQIFDVAGTKMPDKTLFVGVDPRLAFDMMELDFLAPEAAENTRREESARRMMSAGREIKLADGSVVHGTVESQNADALEVLTAKRERRTIPLASVKSNDKGRYIVVTSEFRKLRGYDVGDTFALETGLFFTTKVEFIIVGVVWSPGLDVMLNTFDLPARVREQTAATVLGTLDDAREVFGVKDAFLLAANLKLGAQKSDLLREIHKTLGRQGLTVADVRQLKHDIERVFGRVIMFASTVAWMAMLVATLGVGNAIVAAVRTRQWRLGVLRSIGLTRGELLRLLMAEAMLLSVVGAALGIGFGILLSVNANQLYAVALGFDPPLVIPWDLIAIAGLVVIGLGLLATIVPAALAARRQPLDLLQAGRAAA